MLLKADTRFDPRLLVLDNDCACSSKLAEIDHDAEDIEDDESGEDDDEESDEEF